MIYMKRASDATMHDIIGHAFYRDRFSTCFDITNRAFYRFSFYIVNSNKKHLNSDATVLLVLNLSIWLLLGSIMFHVRRRPADSQPRRRKKKPLGVSNGGNNVSIDREGPVLVEITHSGEGGRHVKLSSEPIEVNNWFQFANTVYVSFTPNVNKQLKHNICSL